MLPTALETVQGIGYGRLFRRVVNKRRDFEHQLSKRLVDQYGMIATEKLNVAGMTASAKGTIENPGKNVKHKAGLNRRILDTSPTEFLDKLKYKIEEAGGTWVEVPTRKVKPSQTCPACGHQEKKKLSDRVHLCAKCGYVRLVALLEADRHLVAALDYIQDGDDWDNTWKAFEAVRKIIGGQQALRDTRWCSRRALSRFTQSAQPDRHHAWPEVEERMTEAEGRAFVRGLLDKLIARLHSVGP